MMTIRQWIRRLEREEMPIEEFYARLKNAQLAIEERLECTDGVDLDALDLDAYEDEDEEED